MRLFTAIYNLFGDDGGAIDCTDNIQLEALDGVVATCTGCDRHSNDDVGGAATTIDGDHSPATWTSSPHSSHPNCATQAYVTIDLGAPQSLTGVTIWHYYGNSRAYCSQKLAISDSGAFAGEEVVVYDTGTCSGWCSFPIVCDGGTSGDCTPDNYGPTETADGNIFTWDRSPANTFATGVVEARTRASTSWKLTCTAVSRRTVSSQGVADRGELSLIHI